MKPKAVMDKNYEDMNRPIKEEPMDADVEEPYIDMGEFLELKTDVKREVSVETKYQKKPRPTFSRDAASPTCPANADDRKVESPKQQKNAVLRLPDVGKERRRSTTSAVTFRSSGNHACRLCKGVSYSTGHDLYKHNVSVHSTKDESRCSFCKLCLKSLRLFKEHVKTHFTANQCQVCWKAFRFPANLKRHMLVHSGLKAYSCEECRKTFTQASSLKVHMTVHTSERAFRCQLCGKDFSLPHHLSQHMRTHGDEREFLCNVCSQTFTHKSSLKRHMKTHTRAKPFVCGLCGRNFSQACELERHSESHAVVRPFACRLCNKGFFTNRNLLEHMRTHSACRAFVCRNCGKTFTNSSHLKRHRQTHKGHS